MARNCLRINHEGDSIQLFWQRGQSAPRPAPSVTFTHPFDEQALADLRWYLELLKLLGGHPFSLRVVLPHLKTQQPKQLIEALRLGLDSLENNTEEGRDKSLTASLNYSFTRLSEKARKHLPFLGLFCERVDVALLSVFSESPDDSYGQAYQAVFGENLQKTDWLGLLNEAAEAGILEHLGGTIFKIHPALPWYLRQRLISSSVRLGINSEAHSESRLQTTQ